jgi:hypothetical protein
MQSGSADCGGAGGSGDNPTQAVAPSSSSSYISSRSTYTGPYIIGTPMQVELNVPVMYGPSHAGQGVELQRFQNSAAWGLEALYSTAQ